MLGLERFERLEPLELGYLAAVVPENNPVCVLDLRLYRWPDAVLRRTLRRFKPNLLGFTAYSHEASEVKRLASLAKQLMPRIRVVIGGHHATVAPHDCNIPCIDYIIRGEGCHPFKVLITSIGHSDKPLSDRFPNILRTGEHFNEDAAASWPQYPEPATLPTPRRDLWNLNHYYCVWVNENPSHLQPLFPRVAMVRTSYGCKMNCSFCIVPKLSGGVHQPRPANAVAEELARIVPKYVYFSDDENFIDEAYGYELAEAIEQRGVTKRYFAWTRATTILRSPDLLKRWKEIGLDGVFVGFEFASNEELSATHKGGTISHNERAHEKLRDLGIACHAAFMVRPEYGREDFARLREYVREMPPAQFSFTVCTPSPGTEDYERIQSSIWVNNAYDLHDCMHPLMPTKLPLREFGELIAQQLEEAGRKNPIRVAKPLMRPWELIRVIRTEKKYARAFRELYRDYPRELWDWSGW